MFEARTFASSVVLDNDTLWIVGGEGIASPSNDWMGYLNTTELIKIDSDKKISHCNGIELPFPVFRHRMIQYNSSAIFLIGGYYKLEYPDGARFSNETWIFDPKNKFEYQRGPSLLNPDRYMFSCAKMRRHNIGTIIVVAGGLNSSHTIFADEESEIFDSVEWFHPTLGWRIGPKMPYKVYDSVMTTSSGMPPINLLHLHPMQPATCNVYAFVHAHRVKISKDIFHGPKITFFYFIIN